MKDSFFSLKKQNVGPCQPWFLEINAGGVTTESFVDAMQYIV